MVKRVLRNESYFFVGTEISGYISGTTLDYSLLAINMDFHTAIYFYDKHALTLILEPD